MKTALVTGGAKRVGAQIVKTLHRNGYDVIIHYRNSEKAAHQLSKDLNNERHDSATTIRADLNSTDDINKLKEKVTKLDLLVNNAAVFYPTPFDEADEKSWNDIVSTNLMSPFFLSQSLYKLLSKSNGCIVNIIDIHAERPLINHSIYNISKSGLAMMTKTLAQDLSPNVRVCGVSPGSILWPENYPKDNKYKEGVLDKIPLKRHGNVEDIADTVVFLANSSYITGQIIFVDGGRSLCQ
jgi:pteridine reductase